MRKQKSKYCKHTGAGRRADGRQGGHRGQLAQGHALHLARRPHHFGGVRAGKPLRLRHHEERQESEEAFRTGARWVVELIFTKLQVNNKLLLRIYFLNVLILFFFSSWTLYWFYFSLF